MEQQTEKRIAVVLLSGGQDSTTCLFWANETFDEVHAVSVRYGQRHSKELEAAAEIAVMAKCASHTVLDLPSLAQIGDSDLVHKGTHIKADGGYADREAPNGLPTSFVPGRNILFLTLVSSLAVKLGAHHVVIGVCQTDYSGYPDCRQEFVTAMEKAVNLGMPSSAALQFHAPLMYLDKAETVRLAQQLGERCMEALKVSVTCYNGQNPGCGVCPACELRAKGFAEAGVKDPQLA